MERTLPSIRDSGIMCRMCCLPGPQQRDMNTGHWYCERCFNLRQPLDLSGFQRSFAVDHHRPSVSSSASELTDSDGSSTIAFSERSSPMNTPVSTPRALSNASRHRGRRSGSTPQGRCSICSPRSCTNEKHKAFRKKDKERANRNNLQHTAHVVQDGLVCYGNLAIGNRQSSGNKNASGLEFRKIDIQRQDLAIGLGLRDDMYKEAIKTGTVDQCRGKLQAYLDRYLENGDPTFGTLMYNPGPLCVREDAARQTTTHRRGPPPKRCITHDHPDWAVCRSLQTKKAFEQNLREFKASCKL